MFAKFLDIVPKYEIRENLGDNLKIIMIEGADYGKSKTKVFAYLGVPKDIPKGEKVPGVVLIHGGGGCASLEWVKIWNSRGYAAIAIDTCGNRPVDYSSRLLKDTVRDEFSGPTNTNWGDSDKPKDEQWFYHAVSATILANSIIRALPSVDENRVGINGISWGGVITCYTIGIDSRFAFAIPVYGCGFLFDSKSEFGRKTYPMDKRFWDPSKTLANAKMPVLFINDSVDPNFSIEITSQSAEITPNSKILVIDGMGHDQPLGWVVEDVYNFANSIVGSEPAFCKILTFTKNEVTFSCPLKITKAVLYWTDNLEFKDDDRGIPRFVSDWNVKEFCVTNQRIQSFYLPKNAIAYYMNLTDEKGRSISTNLRF